MELDYTRSSHLARCRPKPLGKDVDSSSDSTNASPNALSGLCSFASTPLQSAPASSSHAKLDVPHHLATVDGNQGNLALLEDKVRQLELLRSPLGLLPPPGLSMPDITSRGSELHNSGLCKPCAFFHKQQGCQNGSDCLFCHVCPAGELGSRKREKRSVLQRKSTTHLEDLESSTDEADDFVSVGSALHGTGTCKPCAFFHKADGCQNGRECNHCHLCPPGTLAARRKEKKGLKVFNKTTPKRVISLESSIFQSCQAAVPSSGYATMDDIGGAISESAASAPPGLFLPPLILAPVSGSAKQ
jgi:hypothetical protein